MSPGHGEPPQRRGNLFNRVLSLNHGIQAVEAAAFQVSSKTRAVTSAFDLIAYLAM